MGFKLLRMSMIVHFIDNGSVSTWFTLDLSRKYIYSILVAGISKKGLQLLCLDNVSLVKNLNVSK